MRATHRFILAAAMLCGAALADDTYTNTARVAASPHEPTRVWISAFDPLTVAADHITFLPPTSADQTHPHEGERVGCTPEMPLSAALGWETNYAAYAGTLLGAAEKTHLHCPSLKKALAAIWNRDSSKLGILPVEATSTWYGGELVWDIQVRWEYRPMFGETSVQESLGHIRWFVFSQKDGRLISWVTCG